MAAVCAPEADAELAAAAGDDDPPAGAGAVVEVGAAAGELLAVVAGELPDDPQAVASSARHATAPAVATLRLIGEGLIHMSSNP